MRIVFIECPSAMMLSARPIPGFLGPKHVLRREHRCRSGSRVCKGLTSEVPQEVRLANVGQLGQPPQTEHRDVVFGRVVREVGRDLREEALERKCAVVG